MSGERSDTMAFLSGASMGVVQGGFLSAIGWVVSMMFIVPPASAFLPVLAIGAAVMGAIQGYKALKANGGGYAQHRADRNTARAMSAQDESLARNQARADALEQQNELRQAEQEQYYRYTQREEARAEGGHHHHR